jgi:chorismate dehydratase
MTGRSPETVRVGAVNYLNSKPLVEGLAETAVGIDLVLDYPSRLADDLADGRLDVALVPSIACLQNPDYEVISDACVAACGDVLSVKLYCRVPAAKIKTLALDQGSRTSATLVRILLAERYGLHPELKPLPLTWSVSESDADGVLMIGDRAIHPPAEKFVETWDLAGEWLQWTGLPFVFAMWVAHRETDLGGVADALGTARDLGVSRIEAIGRREAPLLGISLDTTIDYLTNNLYYRLGERERLGLNRFYELAVDHGLAPEGVDLVFRNCAAT